MRLSFVLTIALFLAACGEDKAAHSTANIPETTSEPTGTTSPAPVLTNPRIDELYEQILEAEQSASAQLLSGIHCQSSPTPIQLTAGSLVLGANADSSPVTDGILISIPLYPCGSDLSGNYRVRITSSELQLSSGSKAKGSFYSASNGEIRKADLLEDCGGSGLCLESNPITLNESDLGISLAIDSHDGFFPTASPVAPRAAQDYSFTVSLLSEGGSTIVGGDIVIKGSEVAIVKDYGYVLSQTSGVLKVDQVLTRSRWVTSSFGYQEQPGRYVREVISGVFETYPEPQLLNFASTIRPAKVLLPEAICDITTNARIDFIDSLSDDKFRLRSTDYGLAEGDRIGGGALFCSQAGPLVDGFYEYNVDGYL